MVFIGHLGGLMIRHTERELLTAPIGNPAGSSAACEECGVRWWKCGQYPFGLLDIIGQFAIGIACDHPFIERSRIGRPLTIGHGGCGPDSTGGAEGSRIDGGAEWLSDHVLTPYFDPIGRFRPFQMSFFQQFHRLNEDVGIGCRHAALIRFPERHDRRRRLGHPSVERRQTLTSGEKN